MKVKVLNDIVLNPHIEDDFDTWFARNSNCFEQNKIKNNPFNSVEEYGKILDEHIIKKANKDLIKREEIFLSEMKKILTNSKMYSDGIIKIPEGIYEVNTYKEEKVWLWDINGVIFETRDMSVPNGFGYTCDKVVIINR